MSVTPALWRKRREDQDFEVLPGYTASSKLAWAVWHYLCIYLYVCLSSYLSTYLSISPETVSSREDAVVLLWQGWRSWWTERIKSSLAMKLDFPGRYASKDQPHGSAKEEPRLKRGKNRPTSAACGKAEVRVHRAKNPWSLRNKTNNLDPCGIYVFIPVLER